MQYIPNLLSNFNSLFELSAALNIGYAAVPQFAKGIDNFFFGTLYKDLVILERNTKTAQSRLFSMEDSLFSKEHKKQFIVIMNQKISTTAEMQKSIQEKATKDKDTISAHMKFFFLLAAMISIYLLVISGKNDLNNPIEFSKAIFDMYLIAISVIVVWHTAFLYQSFSINIFFLAAIHIAIVIAIYLFSHDFLQAEFLEFGILGQSLTNIILYTLLLPFIVTVLWYILSFYIVSKKFRPKIRKQFEDIEEDIKKINKVAKGSEALKEMKEITANLLKI